MLPFGTTVKQASVLVWRAPIKPRWDVPFKFTGKITDFQTRTEPDYKDER
jgi:hypothetical protein